ncbi:class I fructose-bisphosphate aldolase [Agarilytica rhodophyticola]|uniref:class I fructose-bisphosphate aldolase n=1 Tax=Agarilytica rhodophyticola TaxID=1737490 RepID=UPI001315A4CD|nr:aldolase [Agarilytica rhodophyticola]
MSYIGRKLRQRRLLFSNESFGIIVPIDHGLTAGPLTGISSANEIAQWIGNPNISSIITHRGMLEQLIMKNAILKSTGVIVHLNGMSNLNEENDTKYMVTQVDTAASLGADAVSVQVNFTENNYAHNLTLLSAVTEQAHNAGLPVLAMLYDKVMVENEELAINRMQIIMRLAIELGCDAIKISFPKSISFISNLLSDVSDSTQVFFAGGELTDEDTFLKNTSVAVAHGASGLCAGRNIFQHQHKELMLERIRLCMINDERRNYDVLLSEKSSAYKSKPHAVKTATHSKETI